MSSPLLPLEMFLYIVRQVTCDRTLCTLSLCCRTFRDDAQRTLFYHPRVRSSYPPARQAAFINAIISSPNRLAPMVQNYTLAYFPTISRERINAALCAMSNLKQLGIWPTFQINAEDVTHWTCKLDLLDWGAYGSMYLASPDVLSAILQNQPSLKYLRAYGDTNPMDRVQRDPLWCPNLQGVGGLPSFVNLVLCDGRPIHNVHWFNFPGCQFMVPAIDDITLRQSPNSLGTVKYFSFMLHFDMPDQAFLRHMHSLILIDNIVVCASDGEMADRLDFLTNVPGLQRLILTGSVLLDCPDACAESYMISARRAFSLCNNLRYIDIRHDPSGRTFYRFFPPSTTSGHREMEVTTVGEDEVYAWQVMDFSLVNEDFLAE